MNVMELFIFILFFFFFNISFHPHSSFTAPSDPRDIGRPLLSGVPGQLCETPPLPPLLRIDSGTFVFFV